MAEYSESQTSSSLLERLRCQGGDADWEEFFSRYSPRIYHWCSGRGLSDADAQDATQKVFVRLLDALKRFHYDASKGKFRGWLHQITKYAIGDVLRERGRAGGRGTGEPGADDPLANIPDRSDLIAECEQMMFLEEAEARLRDRVNPWHWEAFVLAKQQNKSPEEIAVLLKKSCNSVRVALHRTLRERKRIMGDLDDCA
ncbi:MAG: sigma-70 family RNA polymerase sigma factor [Pirellulaceae bacterium]|nr:sigma-70 family RNA polymerase sigma factor [Pirellulaceae bacterium]